MVSGRGCPKRSSDRKAGSSGMPEWSLPAPSNLTATAISPSQIDLSWQDNSLGEDGFEVYRSTDGINYQLLTTTNVNVISYSDTTVLGGLTYYYKVRSMNTIGDRSAWSNETSATTPILDAPSSLTATAISFYQVDLSWTDTSDGESGFEIERSTDGVDYTLVATVSANTTFYSDTSAYPSLTNYYRIRDFMTVGTTTIYSNYSNTVSALTFDWAWVPTTWSTVAQGGYHTLAITSNGNLWSWGRNDYGQLGSGDYVDRIFPTPIASDWDYNVFSTIVIVSAREFHSIALKTNGTLWSWGYNGYGQLGTGDTFTTEAPIQIGVNSDWSILTAGSNHTLGLKTNLTLWAWGYNYSGQLGDGTQTDRYTPRQIGTATDWAQTTAGYWHTLVLKTSGTLWTWGYNAFGQLGDGTMIDRWTPRQVGTDSDWAQVSAGQYHTLGFKTNRTLWAWGYNANGQLGDGTTDYRTTPRQIGTATDWTQVSAGVYHTLGLKTNLTLWAWGWNEFGQLGDGTTDDRTTPRQVGTDSDWAQVDAGAWHTLGLKTNLTIWAWGDNRYGQLGLGNTNDRNVPSLVGE